MKKRRFALIITAVIAAGFGAWIAWPLPADELTRDRDHGVVIEDRNGVVLRSTRTTDGADATWVPYAQIDPDLINAFVAVEDRRFWDHHGIDVRAALRATRDNLRSRRVVSGASTITMQLARLLHPARRSWDGKFTQALWALRLDAHLGKQQILEQYLNRVHLGQGAIGVGAASALYFGTSASEMSIGQSAALAGIARAPSHDNPHVSVARARARRDVALNRMRSSGFVTRDEVAHARLEVLATGSRRSPFLAPHFTTRVLAWTPDSQRVAPIRTSLDVALQREAEAEVEHTVQTMRDEGVMQAAAVVLDNATGEVLAWVGSPNFWDAANGQTDMVVSARQPGSALKPFLYGLALDRGFTAATVLPDIPKAFATATGPYSPRNYDRRFRGPVRVREALASSYNVPAVDVAEHVTAASLLHTLHLAGFESLTHDANFYGLGLALGNGDVTLIEMANAYRALANGGTWRPWGWRPAAIASGDTRRVMSPVSAAIVLDILNDPVARMPGFGSMTPFDFPFPVAVKTGTSRHFTDNWAVATTRGFTVAVWAGNFTGKPMEGVSGVSGAGPLLHRIVMATARRYDPGVLTTPPEAGAVSLPVCRLSGLRATPKCAQITEWFRPGSEPTVVDNWERGGRPTLPAEYADWAPTGMIAPVDRITDQIGPAADSSHEMAGAAPTPGLKPVAQRSRLVPVFRILSPLDGDRYRVPPGTESRYATIALRASAADTVVWSVDGERFDGDRWTLAAGTHLIEAESKGVKARVRIVVDK